MGFEPYTYYRNAKEGRAFLLVDCPTDIIPDSDSIILIEWGKGRDEPVRLTVAAFKLLLDKKLMEQFTPKFQL